MSFKELERLLYQITKDESLSLRILNFISKVGVRILEQVHNWENLTVVGN